MFDNWQKKSRRNQASGRASSKALGGVRLAVESLEPRHLLAAVPVISEIVADNEGGLMDQDGDWSDWVEVTNYGDAPMDLDGWFLTDDATKLDRWQFPATNLAVGQSVVVFASNKDRAVSGAEMHTDFQLGRQGERLLLVNPDGATIVSELQFPFMPENTSYGANSSGLKGYYTTTTPGVANSAFSLQTGALVLGVNHSPLQPSANDNLVITAEVDLSDFVPTSVSLNYTVGIGSSVNTTTMVDNGVGFDAVAGDGIYTATLSSLNYSNGDLVRWYVTTQTSTGVSTRSLPWSPSVVDQSNAPEYHGTMILDPAVNSNLPVLYWFVDNVSAAETDAGTRASVYYDGELYENIFVRRRGGSTGGLPKKSFKFDFNQGYHFQFDVNHPRVSEINLNTTYSDKAYIRADLAFETYDLLGAPGSIAFPMRMQRNGSFFSVSMFIEQPDEDLLIREGLDPNGALYKSFSYFSKTSGSFDKKTREFEDDSDLDTFIDAIRNNSGAALTNEIFDMVDVPAVLNYMVGNVLTQNSDQQRKNHYFYRDSEGTGEWLILPWDLDLTFGRHWMTPSSIGGGGNTGDGIWADEDEFFYSGTAFASPSHPFAGEAEHQGNRSWNRLIDKLLENNEFREMYLRRLKSGMDLLLDAPGTAYADRFFETRIDELTAQIGNDATLDYNLWRSGGDLNISQAIADLKNDYLEVRRVHLYDTHSDTSNYGDSADIPASQVANPVISFGTVEDSPVSGNQDEEYIQLLNPGGEAVDISGWRLSGGVDYTFEPGTVIRSNSEMFVTADVNAFRARSTGPTGGQGNFVQGGYSGHISNGGEDIQLVSTDGTVVATFAVPDTRSDVQRFLRVSELNFNPTVVGDATEFIEITNISSSVVLDLTGASITDGPSVPFFFPAGTFLAPGEYRLVVKDVAAFQSNYPAVPGSYVLGQFSGGLNNSEETIKLEDASNNTVLEIAYGDSDPWPVSADGVGGTLELNPLEIDEDSRTEKYYHWHGSQRVGGSPGAAATSPFNIEITEVLSNSSTLPDSIELHNPGATSVNIGGWYLSDSESQLLKYAIPVGTMIPAGEYIVFDESDFNPNPTLPGPNDFGLNGIAGDDVWLTIADASGTPFFIVDDVHFGGALENQTFGPVPGSGDRLLANNRITLGCSNTSWVISEVVVSEIHYHPADPGAAALAVDPTLTAVDLEFVELTNQSAQPISVAGWRIRGGVDADFATGSLAAGQSVLVTSFDPADVANTAKLAAFRTEFGISAAVPIIGGYIGSLSNSTDRVRLQMLDPLSAPTAPVHVLVDEVVYDDDGNWPDADGSGDGLNRVSGFVDGNQAANWIAGVPSPGVAGAVGGNAGDLNGDGVITAADVDIVYEALANPSQGYFADIDLDGDGSIALSDALHLIQNLAGTTLGDANLDGLVDESDFAIWNAHRFEDCGQTYSSGDFNFDGITDVSDLNIWLAGKNAFVAAASSYVPRAAATAMSAIVVADGLSLPAAVGSPDNESNDDDVGVVDSDGASELSAMLTDPDQQVPELGTPFSSKPLSTNRSRVALRDVLDADEDDDESEATVAHWNEW